MKESYVDEAKEIMEIWMNSSQEYYFFWQSKIFHFANELFQLKIQRYADVDAKENAELYNQMSSLKSDDFSVQGHPLIGINIQSNLTDVLVTL